MSDTPRKITSLQRVKPYKDPKGRNPYRGKPIPKGRIEWAIENSLSLKGAARVLGVSYNTLKKYAKRYDLFEQNVNIGGKGVPKTGNLSKYRYKIEDIFACKHPEMPHYKIQEILIRGGLMVQKCMRCSHDETRDYDQYGPFILDFIDNDGNNHKQENLWHTLEWEWLLSLLFKHVYSDGKIFLSFNEESAKNPLDEDLKNYFLKYNPIVNQIDFMLNKPNSI